MERARTTLDRRIDDGPHSPGGRPRGTQRQQPGRSDAISARTITTHAALARAIAFAAVLAGCGTGDGGDAATPGSGIVLFDGPAEHLLPHDVGRTARFRAVATSGDTETTGLLTTRVVSVDGSSFVVEQRSENGMWTRLHARDDGDEIRAVAAEDAESSLRTLDPPVVLVRTPVVAGDTVRSGFRRSLAIVLHTADGDVSRIVPFEGTSERTAIGFDETPLDGRVHPGAIRFRIVATGRASVPTPVGTITLSLDTEGEETLAPDVGLLREEVDFLLRAGGGSARAHVATVRVGEP